MIKQDGLQILPPDERDFSLGQIFKQPELETLPFYYQVPINTTIKDQKDTDFCSAYASTSVSEKQELIELSPEWQFFKTKKDGEDKSWGANLRDTALSFVNFGSMPQFDVDNHFLNNNVNKYKDRDIILDKNFWPESFNLLAKLYQKQSFFKINGRYDLFDNIRSWIWYFKKENRSVLVGALWRPEWDHGPDGFVTDIPNHNNGFGHAFEVVGWQDEYLICKLSNGKQIGDNGYVYFHRNVVNKEFEPYGQYMFQDLPKSTAKEYIKKEIKFEDPWWVVLLKKIIHLFKKI